MSDDTVEPVNRTEGFKQFYGGYTTIELIRKMSALRRSLDDAKAEVSGLEAETRFLGEVAIPEKFAEDGVKNMNVDGIGRINLRADIYASVKAGQKDAAYTWLGDIGAGDLIQPSVNSSTMKAFLKNRLKLAEDIPEDLFNVTPYTLAVITKG